MDRALWLLLWLRLVGWLRRLRRSLATVRGILLALFGLAVLTAWVVPMFLLEQPDELHLQGVRRFGPLGLLAACLLNVLLSSNERAITFSPAEVNLLFPAPVSRRQLLAYKIVGSLGATLLTALFLTLFTTQHTASPLCAFVGMLLIASFLQLFSMALALLASAAGARAYTFRRRLVLAAVLLVGAAAAWQAGGSRLLQGNWLDRLEELEHAPVVEVVLTPVGWFIKAATAERVWPDLLQWSALCLVVIAALLVLVFALDAHYLETAAAASERVYARLERLRRGTSAIALPSGARPRLRLPPLPRWGGVGPLLWRQLTTALRSPWSVVLVLLILTMGVAPMLAAQAADDREAPPRFVIAVYVFVMALFVPPLLPFDFRGDVDRMDVLKSLPLPAWRVAVGQTLAPVVVLSLIQAVVLAALQAWGGVAPLLLGCTAFLLPINYLLFGLENLAFLWFPARLTNAGPGDFQALGRQMLLWVVKFLALGLVASFAGLAGLLAYLVAGRSWVAAGCAVWVVTSGMALGMVPLIALAFNQFDVTRDTPP